VEELFASSRPPSHPAHNHSNGGTKTNGKLNGVMESVLESVFDSTSAQNLSLNDLLIANGLLRPSHARNNQSSGAMGVSNGKRAGPADDLPLEKRKASPPKNISPKRETASSESSPPTATSSPSFSLSIGGSSFDFPSVVGITQPTGSKRRKAHAVHKRPVAEGNTGSGAASEGSPTSQKENHSMVEPLLANLMGGMGTATATAIPVGLYSVLFPNSPLGKESGLQLLAQSAAESKSSAVGLNEELKGADHEEEYSMVGC